MSDKVIERTMEDETSASIEEMLQQDVDDEIEEGTNGVENSKVANIYRGKALNSTELYQMTAKKDTQLILVVGLFHSGKTTMELALYQMFLRGVNKNLQFAGSKTLMDVVERSKGLRITSGNSTPVVARTSKAIEDNYFHIEIVDKEKKRHNVVFTDFAGEIFDYASSNNTDDFLQKYVGVRHIIILVDGEKLSGVLKDQALVECKQMISRLIQEKIISSNTIVHMVYSKNDMIIQSENPNLEEIISKNNEKVKKMLIDTQAELLTHRIAAISCNTEKIDNYDGLESLIDSCLVNRNNEIMRKSSKQRIYAEKSLAKRSFDKFAWKG